MTASHWSTDGIAPSQRFKVWKSRRWPSLAALFDTRPIGPFETKVTEVHFGDVFVQFACGTARRYERSDGRIRADAIDSIGIGLLRDVTMQGRTAHGPFRAGPGAIVLLDLARPSGHVTGGGESIQLAVPRGLAAQHFGPLDTLHGRVIAPGQAAVAQDHLASIGRALPILTEAQRPRIAATIMDVLALALGSDARPATSPDMGVQSARQAAEQAIERRMGNIALDTAALGTELGLSRSALFRLFKHDGGIHAYDRARRLEHVRRALNDDVAQVSLAVLADHWGFSDASHLSRLFRERFGLSPSTYRKKRHKSDGA